MALKRAARQATIPIMHNNDPISLEEAYQHCEKLAKSHYENFPVASFLLPKVIRRAVTVIYTFAREADDFADEGPLSQEQRLELLDHYWQALENLANPMATAPTLPVFIALEDVLKHYPDLPLSLFFDLLRAFKQDVTKRAYAHYQEVLDYCQYSANPIGRLLLYLTHNDTQQNLEDSDKICTALQLINFWQDLKSDVLERNRCYLPQDEMWQATVRLEDLKAGKETRAIHDLIDLKITQAKAMMLEGAALGTRLTGLFGLEIRLIIQGGLQIANALQNRQSVYERPHLKYWHYGILLWKALFKAKNPLK